MQFTISLRLLIISDDWHGDSLTENQIMAHTNQQHKLVSTLLYFVGSGTFSLSVLEKLATLCQRKWTGWKFIQSGSLNYCMCIHVYVYTCVCAYHSICIKITVINGTFQKGSLVSQYN